MWPVRRRRNIQKRRQRSSLLFASEEWMIIWFKPHQTTTLPKWMFLQKLFFKSSLMISGYSAAFNSVPQTAATTFAFTSVCFFFYGPVPATLVFWLIDFPNTRSNISKNNVGTYFDQLLKLQRGPGYHHSHLHGERYHRWAQPPTWWKIS